MNEFVLLTKEDHIMQTYIFLKHVKIMSVSAFITLKELICITKTKMDFVNTALVPLKVLEFIINSHSIII